MTSHLLIDLAFLAVIAVFFIFTARMFFALGWFLKIEMPYAKEPPRLRTVIWALMQKNNLDTDDLTKIG